MKRIGIIGYGAFGKQIENFLLEENSRSPVEILYFDDYCYKNRNKNAYPFNTFTDSRYKDLHFYIGLGYKHLSLRQEICKELSEMKFALPSFVHKTSYINPSANIGQAVYIYPMCNIDQEVEIKDGAMLNNSVVLSHETIINECTFIAPGVTIAGKVTIGKCCFIGAGSIVANNVSIGDYVKVGIGSNVTRNIDENLCVIGNPIKVLDKPFILS